MLEEVFLTNESQKQSVNKFLLAYQNRKEDPYMEIFRLKTENRNESFLLKLSPDSDQTRYAHSHIQKSSLTFIHQNKLLFPTTSVLSLGSRPMAYNTTASLEQLICKDMWRLEKDKKYLDNLLGLKVTRITWKKNVKFSRETTTEIFAWSRKLEKESQFLIVSRNWGISCSL